MKQCYKYFKKHKSTNGLKSWKCSPWMTGSAMPKLLNTPWNKLGILESSSPMRQVIVMPRKHQLQQQKIELEVWIRKAERKRVQIPAQSSQVHSQCNCRGLEPMCRMRQGPTNMKTIPLIWIGQALRQRLGGKRKGKKYPLASVWISSQRVGDQNKEGNL